MIRQTIILTDLILSFVALVAQIQNANSNQLVEVASFEKHQPTGVAVSSEGRVFVNFPLWSSEHRYSVAEVLSDRTLKPYPDEKWNSWKPGDESVPVSSAFVCVQSVWIDDRNTLWILDPAAPMMEEIVPGGPKLVKVNLATNRVERVYPFDQSVAPLKSYLNDVRVDTARNFAYITESGTGALVVLNLETGHARRLLADHPSTKAEDITLIVEGKELRDDKGQTPKIHADGIALSRDGEHLYYHALTGKTLYRIATRVMREESTRPEEIAAAVERVAETVVTDGMLADRRGHIYHTALEQNAIVRLNPEGELETVIQDERIKWPDSMAIRTGDGGQEELYFTTSQIHHMPRFNGGTDTRTQPYFIFKYVIPATSRQAAAD